MNPLDLTWEKMIKLEPRLQELYERARHAAVHDELIADTLWFGMLDKGLRYGFKHSVSKLVGMQRLSTNHTVLRSSTAYNIAYRKLYDALWNDPHMEMSEEEIEVVLDNHLHSDPLGDGFGEMRPINPVLTIPLEEL